MATENANVESNTEVMGQKQNLSFITGFIDSSVVVTKFVQREHCSAAEH
jgi:hypothetical protein